tara:strand:- start:5533 stop:5916 length:384 start_codon:yes stop_codon:yes gene_type:complete
MSSQNEITELRSDIKQQTEAINRLGVNIAQLVESYKHHKEITDRQGEEIETLSGEIKLLNEQFTSHLLTYKPVLDGVVKDKEKKSERTSRIIIGWITAVAIAVSSFFAGITIEYFKQPVTSEQKSSK